MLFNHYEKNIANPTFTEIPVNPLKYMLTLITFMLISSCGGGSNKNNYLTTFIPATSTPWNVSFNPSLPYGEYGASNSSAISISLSQRSIQENHKIFLQCAKGTTYLALPATDIMKGNCNGELNAIRTSHSKFPSFYISDINLITPFKSMNIVGSFANNTGTLIGSPFVIDFLGLNLTVPSGATQILLGFNDIYFLDNTGGLELHMEY